MILQWYFQEDCQATSKTITNIYHPNKKSSPYNGIVKKLSNKILEFLDYRFWVESASRVDSESFWCIPFDGWHINYDSSKNFVWKIREELIQAIDELPSFVEGFINHDVNEYESYGNIINSHFEGKKVVQYSTTYERNPVNRRVAIKLCIEKYGCLKCEVCGFDFGKVYGELGKSFIEVHHNKPLSLLETESLVNPLTDLNCVCCNCHRMIHRNKSKTLTINQLKAILNENK